MTKEEKARYDEPELLGDILKRVLEGRKNSVFTVAITSPSVIFSATM
jgi:hypothetical protein